MSTFFNFHGCSNLFDESSPFPDGQPHLSVSDVVLLGNNSKSVEIYCRIASPEDLVRAGMAVDVFKHNGLSVRLKISYLMGARMDRRLSYREPYTLRVVCGIINSFGCEQVTVFVPHSQATTDLLKNYVPESEVLESTFYDGGIMRCVASMRPEYGYEPGRLSQEEKDAIRHSADTSLVFPDTGACKRFSKSSILKWYPFAPIVTLHKDRDERTGKVLGTKIIGGTPTKTCVIMDDLCDGGATFKSAAETLRAEGVEKIGLVVAHGIFSKGTRIDGIDFIVTTNSFKDHESHETFFARSFI